MKVPSTSLNNLPGGAPVKQTASQEEKNPSSIADDFKPGDSTPVKSFAETPAPAGVEPSGRAESGERTPLKEGSLDNNADLAKQLEAYIAVILSDPQAEAEMIQMMAVLNASGKLRPVLHQVAAKAAETGNLQPMPERKRIEMVDQIADMIDAELRSHGMTPGTQGQIYKNWETMSQEHLAKIRGSKIPPRGPGEMSCFTEQAFLAELEALQGAPFLTGNRVTPLIDGPASFAERDRLTDGATRSIHLLTWAFYDDETGWETARKLAAKHHQGVDVKVVVDGQVAEREPHRETLKYLEEQGVPVIHWRDPGRPYDGQHRKLMVVDGEAAIAGGLNPGNFYSHKGPVEGPKWRDTDVLLEGPAVADCERIFASVSGQKVNPAVPQQAGGARSAVVNHVPGSDAHIMLATMKAIQGASESIDIENAYYIQTPGLKQALLDALARGVRVRLMTNSAESVDEQIVSAPILRSLPELVEAGVEVYIKRGDTLHSKLMVVDGMYSSVGSYNLHPRSERYEGEMTINTLDTQTAATLTQAFENDIAGATRVENANQIVVPENTLTMLVNRYFFDQL